MAKRYLTSIDLSKNQILNVAVHNLPSAPASPVFGQLYYNTISNKVFFYNGSIWVDMTGTVQSIIGGAGLTASSIVNGSLTLDLNVDNATIEINSDTLRIRDLGITSAKINDGAITTVKLSNNAVTLSKLQQVGSYTALGNVSGSQADVSQVVIVTDLANASTTTLVTSAAVKTYIDTTVGGIGNLEGSWDASTGTFPVGTSPVAGTKKGDYWYVTTAGTVGGVIFNIGDVIIAKVNAASTTSAADWIQLEVNRDQATETVLGIIRLATQSELTAGTNDTAAVTPYKLKTYLSGNPFNYLTSNQSISLSGDITGSGTTAITTALANGVVGIAKLSATGTPSSTTYLRGDNTWATITGGSSALSALTDVVLTSPQNGDVLKYDTATSKWVNGAGGSAGNYVTVDTTQTITGTKTFRGVSTNETPTLGSNLLSSTGWATGITGWTGDYTNGWTVVGAGSGTMTNTLALLTDTVYVVTVTATTSVAGKYLSVNFGGFSFFVYFASTGLQTVSVLGYTISATSVSINSSGFDGTISAIQIRNRTSTLNPVAVFTTSSGTNPVEIRTDLSTGGYNVSLGYRANMSIYTAVKSTAVGWSALSLNQIGQDNTAFGYEALQNLVLGDQNTSVGSLTLLSNKTGSNNTAVGYGALVNTKNSYNTALGSYAGQNLATGSNNVALGAFAIIASAASTGSYNIGIGYAALYNLVGNSYNIAIGYGSLEKLIGSGSYNVALGYEAGKYVSGAVTTATAIDNSIFIGYRALPLANSQTNQIVIGYNVVGLGSNTTTIGNSSTTLTALYGSLITGGTSADASAQLQIDSTTKGVLIPRMTSAQRTAITAATGLLVYQTDGTEGTYEKISTGWRIINAAGGVTGTGTQNYVTKWNNAGGTTIGNSLIYDDGASVSIGTTNNGGAYFRVNGAVSFGTSALTNSHAISGNLTLDVNDATNIFHLKNTVASGTDNNRWSFYITTGGQLNLYPQTRSAGYFFRTNAADNFGFHISSTNAVGINVSNNIGSTTLNASAQLQVDSTTKGFLAPRMTTTEKNAIATPATGLMVFDTTLVGFYYYTGSAWAAVTGSGSGGSGTVTSVSVVSANGFAGTVATATVTPAITISTTITGIIKGNGTAISAASAGTDYQAPITLTTTGSSGAATFTTNTLNVPTYTLAGLGGQASSTNLTSLSGLTFASTSFVKMTAAGTFALDTTAYTANLGTVTSVSVTTANGVSGSVATNTTTPAITLTLGAITPTTVNGLTLAAAVTGFTLAGGSTTSKTLTVSNTLTLAGTDTSTLNIGAGGTLGSAAFTASTAYQASNTNLTSVAGLTFASTSFVKMTAAGTFALDTNTYYLASNPSGYTNNTGTVTTVSVTTANGVSGTVATAGTTPAITLSLGAITPTSVNGLTLTAAATGFTIAGGTTSKTLTVSNTLTLAGTDTSTLNIGTGGTLGTAAFTASSAYQASNTNLTSVAGLTFASTSFVKMTAAGTFALDTNTYYLASNPSGYTNNTGTVTTVSVTTANGISGTVATAGTTPAITLSLGAITPTSVNSVVLSGSATPTLAVTGTSSISGSNTGDNAVNSLYSGLVTNATHTGDATGATALTVVGLRGVALPALGATAGLLKYTGTGTNTWVFDTSAYLTANQTITLSGAVTGSGTTAITTTLASSVVGIANLSATGTPSASTYLRGDNTWATIAGGGGGGTGTVTSVSVVSANGFAGSVATATDTPAITLSTTITGLLKGNGTAISAATANTDYLAVNNPVYTGVLSTGTLTYVPSGLFLSAQQSTNSYIQAVFQNSNAGATASTDIVVNNNLSTDSTYYGTFGMNSSGFTGSGSFNLPNAIYLSATTGDLVLGTTTSNAVRFVINSGTTDAAIIKTTSQLQLPSYTTTTSFAGTVAGYLAFDSSGNIITTAAPSGGSGSPGGTSGQIQYNNAGAFGGAAYVGINSTGHLTLTDAVSIPTTPATNSIVFFAENHAGKTLPAVISPTGIDYNLQAALYGNSTYMWLASTGTTVAIAWGTTFTALNAGTAAAQSHPTKASTSAMTSMNRANFGTGSTATGSSGIVSANTVAWLGNAAGLGGFLFFARFGVETISGTHRVLVGLSANTAALAAEPSTLANTIALGYDSTDTTWQIITRSATTLTKTNTAITITAGQILDLYIHSAPNSQSVQVHIKNGATGADLYVSAALTANLPASTQFLSMQAQISSLTGTTAKLLALNRMYLETDI